jgi:hypothetical protein
MSEAWIGFCGGLIGAFVALSKDVWLERRNRAKNAHYLAVHVVTLLDRFVEGCARVTRDDGVPDGGDPGYYQAYPELQECEPTFDPYGLDVDWKSIDLDLGYKILNFPNLVSMTADRVEDVLNVNFENIDYRREQYAALGLKAAGIAGDLRKRYHLPSPDYGEWNPVEKIRQTIAAFEERRQRYDHATISDECVE